MQEDGQRVSRVRWERHRASVTADELPELGQVEASGFLVGAAAAPQSVTDVGDRHFEVRALEADHPCGSRRNAAGKNVAASEVAIDDDPRPRTPGAESVQVLG